MVDQQTYYIRLVGIKTKEAILIESFLTMASGENFVVKVDKADEHDPKAILVDELFHSDSLADEFPGAKVVIIGDDTFYEADDYLHRPLKWSTFESSVIDHVVSAYETTLNEATIASQEQASESGDLDIDFSDEIAQNPALPVDESIAPALTEENYSVSEFSISQIAVKEPERGNEYSESVSHSYSEIGTVIEEDVELVEMEHSRVKAERTLFEGGGLVLGPNIVFWENFDCLMTVKSRPVLYILSSMGSVYSEYNYLDWGLLLKSKYARVYPLPKDWTAQDKLTKYPLSWLVWFSSIARSRGYLLKSINKDGFFMLDSWPDFDQIYNDNHHLRLSSLLSTAPYSIQGLVSKTRLPTKVIVAYLNACEKQSLLKTFSSMEEALELQKSFLPPKAG